MAERGRPEWSSDVGWACVCGRMISKLVNGNDPHGRTYQHCGWFEEWKEDAVNESNGAYVFLGVLSLLMSN